jgi:peroxiredoxin
MKKLILIVLMILCIAFAACSKEEKGKSASPGNAHEGKAAPEFTLKDPDGREVSLSSLKGKVVFLNFWATWCPPCKEEIPSMMKLNQKMAGKPFQMLAVSIDEGGKDAVTAFFKSSGFNLPFLNDPEQKLGKVYGITGVPETFIIDKQGLVVKKVIGGMDWVSADSIQFFSDLAAK